MLCLTVLAVHLSPVSAASCITDSVSFPSLMFVINYLNPAMAGVHLIAFPFFISSLVCLFDYTADPRVKMRQ